MTERENGVILYITEAFIHSLKSREVFKRKDGIYGIHYGYICNDQSELESL